MASLTNDQPGPQTRAECEVRTLFLGSVSPWRPHASLNHWLSRCGPRTIWELGKHAGYWLDTRWIRNSGDGTCESDLGSPAGDADRPEDLRTTALNSANARSQAQQCPVNASEAGRGQRASGHAWVGLVCENAPRAKWLSSGQCLHWHSSMAMHTTAPPQCIANETKLDGFNLFFLASLILLSWAIGRSCRCTKGKSVYLNQGFSTWAPRAFLLWGAVLCTLSGIPGLQMPVATPVSPPLPRRRDRKLFPDVAKCLQGPKLHPVENHWPEKNIFFKVVTKKRKKEKQGCGSKRSRLADTRATYVVGPAMPLSPPHQHDLGDDLRGEEDQDHLYVRNLSPRCILYILFCCKLESAKGVICKRPQPWHIQQKKT